MNRLAIALALCATLIAAGCSTSSAPKVDAKTNAAVSSGAADAQASGTVAQ